MPVNETGSQIGAVGINNGGVRAALRVHVPHRGHAPVSDGDGGGVGFPSETVYQNSVVNHGVGVGAPVGDIKKLTMRHEFLLKIMTLLRGDGMRPFGSGNEGPAGSAFAFAHRAQSQVD